MPESCPKCGNLVAEGVDRCPACGARVRPRVMDEATGFTWADFFNYSFVTILLLVVGVTIPFVLCIAALYLLFLK